MLANSLRTELFMSITLVFSLIPRQTGSTRKETPKVYSSFVFLKISSSGISYGAFITIETFAHIFWFGFSLDVGFNLSFGS